MVHETEESKLADLIERGGVYYAVPGKNPQEVLTAIVEALPRSIFAAKEDLLKAMLEREALMPTAIGKGIALPHPRNPVIGKNEDQFVAVAFPAEKVNWNALDGQYIHAVMLIVSVSAKIHLHTLSKVNFLCREESFYSLLKNHAPKNEIISAVKKIEQNWT
jgi:PTS system nitrogen regulatory IIA component